MMIAQDDLEELELAPLPVEAATALATLNAPPRLVAHLTLVHDVAARLLRSLRTLWPQLKLDDTDVLFGAATHDIGKAVHRDELSGPGSLHEDEGRRALERLGVSSTRARFAATHASWSPASPIEDLLAPLADKCWKGKRSKDLEDLVVAHIAAAAGVAKWDVFVKLDEVLAAIAADADARLEWQARFPT